MLYALPGRQIAFTSLLLQRALREAGRLLIGAMLLFFAGTARGQEAPLVTEVRFTGNTAFDSERLSAQVRTAPNRRFLDIPGLTWRRWVYQVGASGALGETLSDALMESGEEPARLRLDLVENDARRLRLFYRQQGFRKAEVSAQVDTLRSNAARVTFRIERGPPTHVRRVRYDGLETLPPDRRRQLVSASLLNHDERPRSDTSLYVHAANQRFAEPLLHEERQRLMTALRNAGYASVTRDSVRALVFPRPSPPNGPDSVDVTFRLNVGARHRFGDVRVSVEGPSVEAQRRRDTLRYEPTAEHPGGRIVMEMEGEGKLDPNLLRRVVQLRPGTWYDQSDVQATKRRLEATGVFSYSDIQPQPSATPGASMAPRRPLRIALRTRRRHRLRFETFALQRSGVDLSTTGSEVGTGLGVSYNNANLFGNGEAFELSLTGSVAADVQARLFTSAQAEAGASLAYPYLVPPFSWLDSGLRLRQAHTRLSLSLLTARRDALNLIIRGRGTGRVRLEIQHTPSVTSLVDVLDLSVSNPDTLEGFNDRFLSRIIGDDGGEVDDPVQRAQILEDYTQPHVENAFRYTLRAVTVNPLRRRRGHSHEASAEIGGNLPYLLDRFVFSPDEREGTLPGLPFFAGERTSRLRYRRYVRATADLRQYRPLGGSTVLAGKLLAGAAHPVGASRVVPFSRRFYSGGSASVRGWRLRELGPGAVPEALDAGAGAPNLLGGEIKLEASAELRQTFARDLLAARWIGALFADAGNVWFGPRNPGYRREALDEAARFEAAFYKELGVGSGVGLRLDWDYVIARLDLAARVYDPARPGDGLFPNGLDNPVLHFGLGHAF
jgi:outer membrane protein assembly factor BamA